MINPEKSGHNSKGTEWSVMYTLPDGTRVSKNVDKRMKAQEREVILEKDKEYNFFNLKLESEIEILKDMLGREVISKRKEWFISEIKKLDSVKKMLKLFLSSDEDKFIEYINKYVESWEQELAKNTVSWRESSLNQNLQAGKDAEEFIRYYQKQEWLNDSREFSHDKLISFFEELRKKGGEQAVRKRFIEFFGPLMKANTGNVITSEEMNSLQVETLTMRSASQIAGRKIKRSVINFYDARQYNKFIKAIFGESFTPPHGFYYPPGDLNGTIFEKTGMIFALQGNTVIEDAVGHEIRHSIDPYSGDRQNYDRIIDEAFAYYFNIFKENKKNLSGDDAWNEYLAAIDQPHYYELYSVDAGNIISREQYSELCKSVIDAIRKFRNDHNDVETQRMIVQCKTLNDFLK